MALAWEAKTSIVFTVSYSASPLWLSTLLNNSLVTVGRVLGLTVVMVGGGLYIFAYGK